jgi:hypothetical protein
MPQNFGLSASGSFQLSLLKVIPVPVRVVSRPIMLQLEADDKSVLSEGKNYK